MSAHSTAPTTGRFAWLEPVKGLAIFMVIAYHVTLYLKSADVDAVLGRAKAVFELFPMPAFFLIAGIFAGRHGATKFRALWKRRLLPLLYLYVVWSVIRTVFYFVVPGLNGELGEISATDPLALPLILFWPSSSYWFLYALFLFTLGRWLIARAPVWVQLAGSGLVSTLFTSGLVDAQNIGWNRVGALFFFFVLGAVFSREIRDFVAQARPVHLGIAFAALVVSTALIVLGFRWVPLVVLVGQLSAVAVGVLITRYLVRLPGFGIFTSMGTASLKLYLLHLYVIVSATALIELLDPAWPRWVDVGVQVALVIVTVVASFGLARLTSRVRWLYAPPALLRGPRRRGAHRDPVPNDPEAAVSPQRDLTPRPTETKE
ncbi:acyltransferase family protein [Modestobacter sp. VKM Ac-2984]|uniref:acyltransferase family protein n=1 Tax=Modestobacter sp. VKM Ac-2984 TaxID=3004138 RepID=UPI0022AA1649|nr:acyltransferase [Modestobacter sp. VKM Ac-2984]MCZ2817337.1 acyltransferase [Modestobacter sp. VKM Ac-2984]